MQNRSTWLHQTSMGMKAGSEVRFVVAHENGGIEDPWVGPATAQKFPFVAKRLKVYNVGNIGGWRYTLQGWIFGDIVQGILNRFDLLVNFISKAPYPW